jgi:hypothetical protein
MDDSRWEPGMPVLDRQAVPLEVPAVGAPGGLARSRPPDRIPETAPTPLQPHYINLSAVALVAGAIAITALETGSPLSSPIVKLCVIVAAPILVLTTADAALKFWRSAWAWMPLDRGRGAFRLTWVAAALIGLGVIAGAASVVLTA